MSVKSRIITNIENIKVSSNEYLVKYTFWRNIKKLIENDVNLSFLYDSVSSSISITAYNDGQRYKFGDIVWYLCLSKERIVLLRSLFDDNTTNPEYNGRTFEENGWETLSLDVDIYSLDIVEKLNGVVYQYFHAHQNLDHSYGKLTTDNIDDILMRADMSNRNQSRDFFFFPYTTGFLPADKSDNVILNGCYRYYDNGLLEYDIVFRFGYAGKVNINGIQMEALKCNDVSFYNEYQNQRYFYNTQAYDIFRHENTSVNNYSQIGSLVQLNRNDFVNTYFAQINLPVSFADMNYAVFCSQILSQNNNTADNKIKIGANNVVFSRKTTNSITAILITYPEDGHWEEPGYNATHGGLVANSFRCKLIGKAQSKNE